MRTPRLFVTLGVVVAVALVSLFWGLPSAFVLGELRLPRVVGALAVGALLAWSGLLLQAVFRNPLVSPDFLGVENGASAAAVLGIVVGVPSLWITPLAFVGSTVTVLALYALSWRGHLSGSRLVLVGVGVNALLAALISFLLVTANVHQAAQAYQWMVGSLYSVTTGEAWLLVAGVAVLGPLAAALVPSLQVLQLGDVAALSLGVPVETTRRWLLVVTALLAGLAVSLVGPIGFVALAVPHAARLLFGPLSVRSFVAAGLLGAGLLVSVDLAAQRWLPWSLPVGLWVAALGGPYFLFLLRRRSLVL